MYWFHTVTGTLPVRKTETQKFIQKYIRLKDDMAVVCLSVADPECFFRIPDPNFFHPGSRIKKISGSRIRIRI